MMPHEYQLEAQWKQTKTNENEWKSVRKINLQHKQKFTKTLNQVQSSLNKACKTWPVMLSAREAWPSNSGADWRHWRLENKMNWTGAPGGAPYIYIYEFNTRFSGVRQGCALYIYAIPRLCSERLT